jgi:hypothetical protein
MRLFIFILLTTTSATFSMAADKNSKERLQNELDFLTTTSNEVVVDKKLESNWRENNRLEDEISLRQSAISRPSTNAKNSRWDSIPTDDKDIDALFKNIEERDESTPQRRRKFTGRTRSR